jgi:hypothetical protein
MLTDTRPRIPWILSGSNEVNPVFQILGLNPISYRPDFFIKREEFFIPPPKKNRFKGEIRSVLIPLQQHINYLAWFDHRPDPETSSCFSLRP